MDPGQSYKTFKQINYRSLTKKALQDLYNCMCLHYSSRDEETNSNYWNTGIRNFDLDLEEFESFYNDSF